jgi:hypothetical protein
MNKGHRYKLIVNGRVTIYNTRQRAAEVIWMRTLARLPYSVIVIPPAARASARAVGIDWRTL